MTGLAPRVRPSPWNACSLPQQLPMAARQPKVAKVTTAVAKPVLTPGRCSARILSTKIKQCRLPRWCLSSCANAIVSQMCNAPVVDDQRPPERVQVVSAMTNLSAMAQCAPTTWVLWRESWTLSRRLCALLSLGGDRRTSLRCELEFGRHPRRLTIKATTFECQSLSSGNTFTRSRKEVRWMEPWKMSLLEDFCVAPHTYPTTFVHNLASMSIKVVHHGDIATTPTEGSLDVRTITALEPGVDGSTCTHNRPTLISAV